MAPKAVVPIVVEGDPQAYEDKNVHLVYDRIAPHFSSTRYKPWPVISAFMSSIATGWIGLDAGTGNGKYLPLPLNRPNDIFTIGLDRSLNLLRIAQYAGEMGVKREVVWGDVLGEGWRKGIFDYAISIATIHHLSTHERRLKAVKTLIESVSPRHGRILIYVWAIEQDELSKRKIPQEGDRPPHEGKDVVVPWVLSRQTGPAMRASKAPEEQKIFNRYYHMFAKGELSGLVHDAIRELDMCVGPLPVAASDDMRSRGVEIVEDGWERSNYYIELGRWQVEE